MANQPMVSYSTGAMNSLLDKLTKLRNHSMLTDLQKDLESLTNDFLDKFAGGRETGLVKVWKKQVRELVYNIEDWIEPLVYDIEDWIEPKPPPNLGESEIKQIEEFKAQIKQARMRCERYHLLEKAPISDANPADVRPSKVTIDSRPLWEEKAVLVAVDDPKKELEKLLMNEDEKLKVVSIVGMEGHGKTTLAKEIYGKLQGQFECQAFVSVGRRPSMRTTLMDILRQVKQDPKSHGVQGIITELWEFLSTKRYFILIDGIGSTWDWKVINCALSDKNRGSRILTTTCIMDVAKSCSIHPNDAIYRMEALSDHYSRSLFCSRISVQEKERPGDFNEVADDMLRKCGGVPLAIIVTAGLLDRKSAELGPSKKLQESISSALDQYSTSQGIRKLLDMSYADLSLPLKSCFLYLSAFPENHTIKKDRLIRIWIAEGFIPKRDEESLWETGESYFNELISRRLIQPVFDYDDGQAVGCTVHGVILDFIASLSSEDNFVTTGAELRSGPFPRDTIRRFSFDCSNKDEDDDTLASSAMRRRAMHRLLFDCSNKDEDDDTLASSAMHRLLFDCSNKDEDDDTLASSAMHLSRVRSLTFFGDVKGMPGEILLLRFLRVLDLEDAGNLRSHHLEGIEGLVLLRYLGLRGTGIDKLPEEIGELQHLETLDLRRTTCLRILPASIAGLRKLVRLLLSGRAKAPEEIWKMQQLEEVSTIGVGNSNSLNWVSELLIKLKRLRMLSVRWSINSYDRQTAMSFLNEVGKSSLQSLILQCNDILAEDFLYFLLDSWVSPHHLRRFELTISGTRVPSKMDLLVNLTHLRIEIDDLDAEGLRALGDLPNLILLGLNSSSRGRLIISKDCFLCLVVFSYRCPVMGLQFTPGAMPQLRRLQFQFYAREIKSSYGGFDFGIQHLSCLTRVHATIHWLYAGDLDAAEAAIREQVSNNPNSPVLELRRKS